jgi:beta-xylosidase
LQEKRHDLDGQEAVQFRIEAKPESYTFSFKVANDASWIEVGILPMRVLMEQSARESVFTGTHLGLYAQGWGSTSCLQPASFSFASFTENDEL